MSPPFRWLLSLTLALALTGCSEESSEEDAGTRLDAGSTLDSGTSVDAGASEDSGTTLDSGTSDADAGTRDAGDPSSQDAGSGSSDAGPQADAWDGGAETLPELSDWLTPPLYSECSLTLPTGSPITDCKDLSLFDLSSCPAGAFDTLESVGTYHLLGRGLSGYVTVSYGLTLPFDGAPGTLNGRPLTRQSVGPGSFVFSTSFAATPPYIPARDFTFVGCTRPEPRRVNGCYVQCADGKVRSQGTFTALRPSWGRGESESSGGLTLHGEASVPLGFPVDVYVAKDHAYVVAIGDKADAGGLAVFDVKNRSKPVLTKRIQLPGDSYWNGVWAKGDALYIASTKAGVIVYDISNPADPQYMRAVPGEAIAVHTVHVQGDRLYAMAPEPASQTLLFDVTSPLSPVLLNRVTVSGEWGGPHDATAYGDRLYINSTSSGFVAFDVSNPEHALELGAYVFGRQYAHASAVGTFAGRTIAFEGGEGVNAHLRVLDVTDPANMRLIGEYGLRPHFSIHNMILKGTKLYIAYYHEGVRVLDVSVPPKPREVAYFNTFLETQPGRSSGMFEGAIGIRVPGDGYVYVVDTARGLLIFNEL
ncbi:hypothetical protein D7X74_21875 [Corallococcus sp. CA047B]|uniref:LVIVD repeat-containing protein n=1 Tax=Corallococcus sp. CA047B TaxID=2316729 RepID=UPI000EA07C71|nr:hypothetical protein [Corallococcus sp. CA047B]RKH13427.1 hypothetical protein D7X74_21875 [Corallococcus sp. CA047B]